MAIIQPVLKAEIDPLQPVPEALAIISSLLPYHPNQEAEILQGVKDAIDKRLHQLKGVEDSGK